MHSCVTALTRLSRALWSTTLRYGLGILTIVEFFLYVIVLP